MVGKRSVTLFPNGLFSGFFFFSITPEVSETERELAGEQLEEAWPARWIQSEV